jgi:hypothetical protein
MRTIFALLFILSDARAWEIVSQDESTFLQDPQLKSKEEIVSHPTIKKVETKNLSEDITLITYLENQGGTTSSSESYNCAAYSKKLKKFLFKDLACKSLIVHSDGKKEAEEATFKIEGSTLSYTFDELKKKFDLSK